MYSKNVDRDAYFTPESTAVDIVDYILSKRPEWKELEWFEPSAGGGVFIDAALNAGVKSVTGVDIHPMHPDVIKADYLDTEYDLSGKIVFGNPPYGKIQKLTIAFINKAFSEGAEAVAFLLMGGMLQFGQLKRVIGGEVCFVKSVPDKFESPNGTVKLSMECYLMVFKKTDLTVDYKVYSDSPYCVRKSKDKANVILTHEKIGLSADSPWTDLVVPHRAHEWRHVTESGKIILAAFVKFYNISDYTENSEFITRLAESNINGRLTPPTLNFWLSNKDKIEF